MKVSSIYYLCFLNNKKYLKSSENKTLWLRNFVKIKNFSSLCITQKS